jgi:hypothetical protein
MSLHPASAVLLEALCGAYPDYVRGRLAELGTAEPPGLEEALAGGREWLRAELAGLLSQPFALQGRGPLEVFQEAMRFPTEALAAAGAGEAERDEVTRAALPGDRYHLAPASSVSLGEEAWRAHLAWGAVKARALTAAQE